jgi:uncharacterized protein (TIGR02001 family)
MLNKKLLSAAVATALLSGVGATTVQAFEIAANTTLTSDYRFRGISQSDKNAAIQGGFDASWEPGFYLGTWASSVDFGDADPDPEDPNCPTCDPGSYGSMEIDYYAGWVGPIGDTDFGIDAGYMYYQYPGDTVDPEGDYQEFHLKGSWRDLSIGATYSDDYYAESGKFWYFAGDYSYSFNDAFSVGLHAGYNDFDEVAFLTDGADNYTDFSVTLTYSVFGVDLSAAYVGTNLDDEEYYDTDLADNTGVVSISKSF